MKASHGIWPVFDERNLVSAGGLVPAMVLAEKVEFTELINDMVSLPVASVAAKTRTLVAGMLAGADCIDDLDVLRSGGTQRVLEGVRAPSTIGTFLRTFTHGHVQQLRKVSRQMLVRLAGQTGTLVGADDLVLIDIDDTIREVHGYAKQGAGFGYNKVRGLNAMLTTISTPSSAPVIAESSLRRGKTSSGKGAAQMLRRALVTAGKITDPKQRKWVRGDSAFCTHANVTAATKGGAWFSFTIPMWATVTAAITEIDEDAWTPITYPNAIRDPATGELISDAEVAEIGFTVFTSRKKADHTTVRLIVRRVKRLGDAPAGQGELFDVYRYHPFITNTTLDKVDADRIHRGHAIIEQTIAELKGGPLAHLPSGRFSANAAWLTCAVIAFNLARAIAHSAGTPTARMATIIRRVITVPARLAATGRRLVMHLPAAWPWQAAWANLWHTATGPPRAVTP